MEFNEKLQDLRKQKGITQEELAKSLYVSRTAISKWESGRGYPNIDSLRAIAKFFGVTVDELLSGDELLFVAEEDTKQKENHFRDMVFGLLDCSIALFFFIPLFKESVSGVIRAVSLFSLSGIAPYLRILYFIIVFAIMLSGILTIALQNCHNMLWISVKSKLSLALGAIGVLLFIISLQPYATALLMIFLTIKVLMLIKW